jgi:pimeloyl-ACP methyl ester carboxylesterase
VLSEDFAVANIRVALRKRHAGADNSALAGFCLRGVSFVAVTFVVFRDGPHIASSTGMIAQQAALDRPEVVAKLILLGTGPRGGEGMTYNELSPDEQVDPVSFLLAAFFTPSEASQTAGREYIERLSLRTENRDLPVSRSSAEAQLVALREWGVVPAADRYSSLRQINQPTLICHGARDIVVSPINALMLAEHLPNATLIAYPDSSHGSQYQHARLFLEHVRLFLRPESIRGEMERDGH